MRFLILHIQIAITVPSTTRLWVFEARVEIQLRMFAIMSYTYGVLLYAYLSIKHIISTVKKHRSLLFCTERGGREVTVGISETRSHCEAFRSIDAISSCDETCEPCAMIARNHKFKDQMITSISKSNWTRRRLRQHTTGQPRLSKSSHCQ